MKAILKKVNGVYHKGSEQGMALVKTAFYYGFIPTVLLLGNFFRFADK